MTFKRASGILLHPTSLPGPYGIGDIGFEAFHWVNFLASTGCGLWQILPLGPTGFGDSPYQCFSAFAGNPLLISPDLLSAEGLLKKGDLDNSLDLPLNTVDFGAVIPNKLSMLNRAYANYQSQGPSIIKSEFEAYKQKESHWLDDFSLFMAIKEKQGGGSWIDWPDPLRKRDPKAIETFKSQNLNAIESQAFRQFLFFRQWDRLRDHAHNHKIQIIGDIPIFVAHDSADVWAHPELFYMDEQSKPTVVAGVPPDYFSPTGQLWGNPLYRWDVHAEDGYSWWISRFKSVLSMVDIVRLDHFRGFSGYWEIPAGQETAVKGRWVKGPGEHFLNKIQEALVELPIIAEDLGVITEDVVAMRKAFNLPGMKVLVFAFNSDANNIFLPHNFTRDYVVYTGTHDNDTVLGWYKRVDDSERDFARRYLAREGYDISWDLIRAAWSSVAVFALAPMQDFLRLDNSARMNYPSKLGGNWNWRMLPEALNEPLRARIAELNTLYGRNIIKPLGRETEGVTEPGD